MLNSVFIMYINFKVQQWNETSTESGDLQNKIKLRATEVCGFLSVQPVIYNWNEYLIYDFISYALNLELYQNGTII